MDLEKNNNPDFDEDSLMDPENFALTGGIEPGGLRTKIDIKILVCYILNTVGDPLSTADIVNICQEKGLANYFEVTDAISSLIKNKNISVDRDGYCKIEEDGIQIADMLEVSLPLSVRDKALEAALVLLASAKSERENSVEIERTEQGYNVTCHISGGDMDLMKFTIYVPDLFQARLVKRNFHRDPEGVYKLLLSSVTGNRDLAKTFSSGSL